MYYSETSMNISLKKYRNIFSCTENSYSWVHSKSFSYIKDIEDITVSLVFINIFPSTIPVGSLKSNLSGYNIFI